MTIRRTSSRTLRGLLAATALCVFGTSALAGPPSSREYPPTYSSHTNPWYDPFGWLTSSDKKPAPAAPAPAPKAEPNRPAVDLPPGTSSTPAWKWYGYGTPAPGGSGAYPVVPGNWYSTTGATPGAIPQTASGAAPGFVMDPFHSPGVVADPAPGRWPAITVPPSYTDQPIVVPPPNGPMLPGAATLPPDVHPTSVNWKSSAATLRNPAGGAPADDRPPARLKAPLRSDETSSPPAAAAADVLPAPRTPAEAARGPRPKSPDLPVEPAPGIVMPAK